MATQLIEASGLAVNHNSSYSVPSGTNRVVVILEAWDIPEGGSGGTPTWGGFSPTVLVEDLDLGYRVSYAKEIDIASLSSDVFSNPTANGPYGAVFMTLSGVNQTTPFSTPSDEFEMDEFTGYDTAYVDEVKDGMTFSPLVKMNEGDYEPLVWTGNPTYRDMDIAAENVIGTVTAYLLKEEDPAPTNLSANWWQVEYDPDYQYGRVIHALPGDDVEEPPPPIMKRIVVAS